MGAEDTMDENLYTPFAGPSGAITAACPVVTVKSRSQAGCLMGTDAAFLTGALR